jgi:PAS domain S-box-containing protein
MKKIEKTNDELLRELNELKQENATLKAMYDKDITERKHAEENLKKSEESYRNLIDNALVGVYKISFQGNIIWANQAMLNIIDYDGDDYTRLNVIGFYKNPGDRDELIHVLKEKGEMKNYETELISYKGKSLNVNINMNIEGNVITGMLLDITERKQAEAIVKKTNEELIKLNAEKDKFFSIIAHDLKSPFNGFLGLTELMADKTENFSLEEVIEQSKSLNKAAKNLYKLLANLLEWAQVQNGSINFTPKNFDLSRLVSQSIDTIAQRALQKGITIVNEIGNSQKVYADDKMIGTVLRNLLSNAVKFTRKDGKVILSSKRLDNGTIEVSVTDNGVGIPEKDVKRLFRVEEKVSTKGTDGELSTGLGLLLCKEFVEMHRGKIWAESKENVGSTFYFTFP